MTSAQVSLDDLLIAFEYVNVGHAMEHEAYLCIATGNIYYHSEFGDNEEPLPDDIDDTDKYVSLPHKNDLDLGKRLALRFTDQYIADEMDNVDDFFRHKGAYRQFKSLIERRGVLQQWYEFEERSKEEAIRQWCEDHEITLQG